MRRACQHGLIVSFCYRCWVNKYGQAEPFERWVKRVCSKPRVATKDEAEVFFAQAEGWLKTTPGAHRFNKVRYDAKCAIAEYSANQRKLTLFPCTHSFRDLTKDELADKYTSVVAYCEDCQCDMGWRCKESPDGVCHYYTIRDRDYVFCVELVNKELHHNFPREDWAPEHESYDKCLYCGVSEERK